jgi:beta-glucuronidase
MLMIVFLRVVADAAPDHVPHGNAHRTLRLESGWKFLFTGSDSSTEYATTKLPDSCPNVTIPHIFPSGKPGGAPLAGCGWYVRDVAITDSFAGYDLSLVFEGVCLRGDVFVNGARAGGCGFAYMPFTVDLGSAGAGDTLHIAVRIDSRLLPRQIPDPAARGWRIYGGMQRDVVLLGRPKARIDDAQVRTICRGADTFDLHCSFRMPKENRWDSVRVAVVRPEAAKNVIAGCTMHGSDTVLRVTGITPWTPENPVRYELRCVPFFGGKKGAVTTVSRGFCQLTSEKSRLLLNGRPYYLRGMARHDMLSFGGTPPTRDERRRDLADLKELGVNFLRIAHFPQARDVYELCDSIGLLVMDEIPAWKTDPKFLGSAAGHEYASAYMRELVNQHGNFTSICIWSIGNQIQSFKTSVADFVTTVASATRAADPSRLVTFCSYYYQWDRAFSAVDIIAINEYFGWELASLDMLPPMLEQVRREWPDKPVIVSEFGAQAQLGLRNADARLAGPVKSLLEKDISEDHQALFIGAHMDTIRGKSSFVGGMVVWSYNDYLSTMNKKRAPGTPEGLNACGIVTETRGRKLSYDVVRRHYTAWRDSGRGGD